MVGDIATARVAAAAATLHIDTATAAIMDALEAKGIPAILLKGPVIASWLYDPHEVRPYSDIDLLVPLRALGEAERALSELGFVEAFAQRRRVAKELGAHAVPWVRHRDGVIVDLHIGFWGLGTGKAVWDVLSEGAERLRIAGGEVRVPSPSRRALIVALHALQHADLEGCRLELQRCLERCPYDAWLQAALAAEELGAERPLSRALRLLPAGCELLERLSLDVEQMQEGFDWTLATAALDVAYDRRSAALRVATFHEMRGWGNKLRLLLDSLAPAPEAMRLRFPLARRGRPGLAAAYLLRYARLPLRVVPVLWALHSARRAQEARRLSPRLELLAWGFVSRLLLHFIGLRRSLATLDLMRPGRRRSAAGAPTAAEVRGGGACLSRTLARSQYLRRRHVANAVVIGVTKPDGGFAAHAWLEPFDRPPPDYVEIRRIER